MRYDTLIAQYMAEAKPANNANTGKRVKQELMSYIDKRKDDMDSKDYDKSVELANKISADLNPDTIIDDLTKIGEIVGLHDSYEKIVGEILTIVDQIDDKDTFMTSIFGEPEAEPEAEPAPEEEEEEEEEEE